MAHLLAGYTEPLRVFAAGARVGALPSRIYIQVDRTPMPSLLRTDN